MQAVAGALHAAAGRRPLAYRSRALAALDAVLRAAQQDLYKALADMLLEGCLAAGRPPDKQVLPPHFCSHCS